MDHNLQINYTIVLTKSQGDVIINIESQTSFIIMILYCDERRNIRMIRAPPKRESDR